jgi:hypothetical protein
LLAAPAHAQQEPSPLAALVGAGAPLVASVSSTSAGGAAPDPVVVAAVSTNPSQPGATPALSAGGVAPGIQPGITPAIELPGIPNPLDLLDPLDPRKWAGDILDAVMATVGGALIEAQRVLDAGAVDLDHARARLQRTDHPHPLDCRSLVPRHCTHPSAVGPLAHRAKRPMV